jgi:Ca2+-binding RTX toxin-like protein
MNVRKTTTLALSVGALAATASAPGLASDADDAAAATCFSTPATIVGTAGNDTINGTSGADVIAALGGNDVVRGLGGNDVVCLGAGRDAVKGGAGDDQFRADATIDGNDTYVGDSGRDSMSYLFRTRAIDVTLDGEGDDGEGTEADNVRPSVENVTGGQASDLLVGSDVTNALFGGDGEDDLRGGLGNDSLSGGNDDDQLIGNAGNDFGFGNSGDDTWLSAAVTDGSDTYEGSVGIDTISYEGRNAGDPVTVRIDNVANDGSSGERDNVRLDVENVIGGSGNDTIAANQFQAERNTLRGGFGNDSLSSTDPTLAGDIVDGGASSDLCFTDDDDTRLNCEF